jgi:methionine-rich copper-binding protein CopC
LAGGVALLVTCVLFSEAAAHADYERSEPPAGAVVTTAPAEVRIYFTQDLFRRQGMNGIEVYDADGVRVDQDDPAIDDDNRRLMQVTLQPDLPDGLYTVRWFSLSAEDGHEGEGEFTFTVATGEIAATSAPVNTTGSITPAAELTVTEVITADLQPTEEMTTPAPDVPTATIEPPEVASSPTPVPGPAGVPCLGGAAPLGLMLGLLWIGRRRTGCRSWN